MNKQDVKELERPLKALANRRRLAILRYLKNAKEATVGEIAEEIHLSFKATSRHLGILAACDIVEKEQQSISMFYRLSSNQREAALRILALL